MDLWILLDNYAGSLSRLIGHFGWRAKSVLKKQVTILKPDSLWRLSHSRS
jgi:hypothetical protein